MTPLQRETSSRLRRRAVLLCVLLCAWPPRASGYALATTVGSGIPLSWQGSSCIFLRVNSLGGNDFSDGGDRIAVKQAIKSWQSRFEDCSYLRFFFLEDAPKALPGYDNAGRNENVITWIGKDWPFDPGVVAMTVVVHVDIPGRMDDGRILDADILLNDEFQFDVNTPNSEGTTDILATMAHELGHLLGLAHPCYDGDASPVPTDNKGVPLPSCAEVRSSLAPSATAIRESTMYPYTAAGGSTAQRIPTADERQAICDAYPRERDPGQCSPVDFTPREEGGCSVAPAAASGWRYIVPLGLALLGLALLAWWRLRRS